MSESAERRARPSVGNHRVAARQQKTLRDVLADHDVVGLSTEGAGIVLAAHGHDEVDLVAQCLDQLTKEVQICGIHIVPMVT